MQIYTSGHITPNSLSQMLMEQSPSNEFMSMFLLTKIRSDFLGAILPILGKDWTQPGIAPLFANIHRNGYQVLYLTSRAIGQIGFTRDFVKSVHQDGKNLPQGPIISSPDQLLSCFKREIVFSKPEVKPIIIKDLILKVLQISSPS